MNLVLVATAPPGNTPVLLYVFGSMLAGGGLAMIGNLVRHWRRGQIEDTELVSRITKDTISGAKDILAEYRIEVEVVRRQVEDYRKQLNELSMALAGANLRINKLEEELDKSAANRAKLMEDLRIAVEERQRLTVDIAALHNEINRLLMQRERRESVG